MREWGYRAYTRIFIPKYSSIPEKFILWKNHIKPNRPSRHWAIILFRLYRKYIPHFIDKRLLHSVNKPGPRPVLFRRSFRLRRYRPRVNPQTRTEELCRFTLQIVSQILQQWRSSTQLKLCELVSFVASIFRVYELGKEELFELSPFAEDGRLRESRPEEWYVSTCCDGHFVPEKRNGFISVEYHQSIDDNKHGRWC